jgi:uncharacterized protein
MKLIKRSAYNKKIKPFIGKGLIKVLTGQRRTGKSCIMQQIAGEIQKETPGANIIYINKELLEYQFIIDDASLSTYVKENLKKRKKNYLFIDEIQEIKNFEKALRSLNAKNECDIFCTGSNAQLLSGELSTFLAGRYIEIHIYGLSYQEFLTFNKLKDADDSLMKYLAFGGLPHLMHFNLNEEIITEYLKNIYSTILLKDIIAREGIRNVHFLENLSVFLADNTGSIVSALKINKYLKSQSLEMSTSAILSYIRSMCNAFVVNRVERYDIKGKRRFELNEKYYFEDHGIRNILVGTDVQRDIHKIIENVVWLHLKRCGFDVAIGKLDDYEIDFVGRKGTQIIYVQVVYLINSEESHNREFGNLEKIKDNYSKFVVSLNPFNDKSDYRGIRHIHLREFLKMDFAEA